MMVIQEKEVKWITGVDVHFENGKTFTFVNTTPHDIVFKDPKTGTEFTVPKSGVLINAKPVEKVVDTDNPIEFVTTEFQTNSEDEQKLTEIEEAFKNEADKVIVIGSIIAAQAYKGRVYAMTPHPDYVRVAPNEKRMNPRKFTVFTE